MKLDQPNSTSGAIDAFRVLKPLLLQLFESACRKPHVLQIMDTSTTVFTKTDDLHEDRDGSYLMKKRQTVCKAKRLVKQYKTPMQPKADALPVCELSNLHTFWEEKYCITFERTAIVLCGRLSEMV